MNIFSRTKWVIVDCLTGKLAKIDRLPYRVGKGPEAQLRLEGDGVLEEHCVIKQMEGSGIAIAKSQPEAEIFFDGLPIDAAELEPYADHSIKIGSYFLVIRGDKDIERWRRSFSHQQWMLYAPGSSGGEGPMSLAELRDHATTQKSDPKSAVVICNLGMGFYLGQIIEALAKSQTTSTPATSSPPPSEKASTPLPPPSAPPVINAALTPPVPPAPSESLFATQRDVGPLTCIVCWKRFDSGDLMHIAVHESLRGDPLLGTDAMLRFHATHFDDRLRALDPRGIACTEIACPHCHRAMPQGFIDTPHHILSIVGDQSAGKSYYLSVLIHQLPISLLRHFSARFHDSDPAGNALLNQMRSTLFGARTPEEAKLAKTQLEGVMYESVPKDGRLVPMPKPFVYHLESAAVGAKRVQSPAACSFIFYDNAGEHFQPGRDSVESPGAQHVASSAGIFFLFDPFNSPEFRRRMANVSSADPQMEKLPLDQQDTILAEMRIRIARLLNLGLKRRMDKPLAILIGKCDAWLPLLNGQKLVNPLDENGLSLKAIEHNSHLVRDLVLEIAPKIVGNAEGISDKVLFFPVSSFGHTPVRTQSGDCVPDPSKLNPVMTEIPALWIFSQIVPDLVPLS
jgi:hypothetical protein